MDTLAIRTNELKKSYRKGILAVDGLSIEVRAGGITGFLGPNGAGKSTTIKMLLGLLEPTHGSIEILGEKVGKNSSRIRRKIGFMPELPRFPKYLTANELLEIYGQMSQISPDYLTKQKKELLKEVGLEEKKDERISSYSKGMMQRLGLAVAFLGNPELVVLDEPTEGLDPLGMVEVKQMIKRKSSNGTTVFLSSHLLKEVEEICDNIIIINKGKLVATGSVSYIVSLTQKKRVIEIEVDRMDSIEDSLRALPFVSSVTVKGNNISLELDTREDVRGDISGLLASKGVKLLRIDFARDSLENAFVELIKEEGK